MEPEVLGTLRGNLGASTAHTVGPEVQSGEGTLGKRTEARWVSIAQAEGKLSKSGDERKAAQESSRVFS